MLLPPQQCATWAATSSRAARSNRCVESAVPSKGHWRIAVRERYVPAIGVGVAYRFLEGRTFQHPIHDASFARCPRVVSSAKRRGVEAAKAAGTVFGAIAVQVVPMTSNGDPRVDGATCGWNRTTAHTDRARLPPEDRQTAASQFIES